MSGRLRSFVGGFVAVGLAASLAACSSGSVSTSASPTASGSTSVIPSGPGPNLRQADLEWVEVCKDYVGTPGPAAQFTVAVDSGNNGSIDQTFNVSIAGGTCQDVWFTNAGQLDVLTITETVPAGYTASSVTTLNNHGTITVGAPVSGNVASNVLVRGLLDAGSLVVFTNTGGTPPPPPPGIAGCTPGYWKQSQHFDSWPAPYTPNTQFSAVFENAFPGMTLLEVASQGGGGLNALGRHTVAALLSAGSVNYGMTPAEVIAAFNAVFPASSKDGYDALHNQFAAANERGCPLN